MTIDVAYRYAATPTRKFIIADCPGHVQYTRNMATGASTADLALVVVDVAAGLKEETRRHLCIAALLGVRNLIVAVNKMDKVEWSQEAFQRVSDQVHSASQELGFASCEVIPVSALNGDNVVDRTAASSWYSGPSVLEALETTHAGDPETNSQGARLPIQWVLRQNGGGRTYAGMVNGGTFHVGDTVTLLPAGIETTISALRLGGGERSEAYAGLSADIDLAAETDAGRGDMIACAPLPTVTREFDATICWFGERPMSAGQRLRLKHTTKSTPARVVSLDGLVDIEHLTVASADGLSVNQIGIAKIACADALVVDDYQVNRATGSFVLVDEVSNATVAAGMIGRPSFL